MSRSGGRGGLATRPTGSCLLSSAVTSQPSRAAARSARHRKRGRCTAINTRNEPASKAVSPSERLSTILKSPDSWRVGRGLPAREEGLPPGRDPERRACPPLRRPPLPSRFLFTFLPPLRSAPRQDAAGYSYRPRTQAAPEP